MARRANLSQKGSVKALKVERTPRSLPLGFRHLGSVQKLLCHRNLAMLEQRYSHVAATEVGCNLMAVLMAE